MGRRANSSEGVASGLTKPGELASIAFGEWILDSDFADVLGAGLGAAYGLLPSKLIITPRRALDSGQASGGMVLGDMGTHLTDDDIGQNKEEREREQRRERLWVGLGVSGSEEFRAQMDLFLKLIEFTQDVLRNTSSSGLDDYYLSASDPPRSLDPADQSIQLGPTPSEIVASAISSSVLSSIRNLFLNAIMYPSILECSEADGSAVAVMSYLEAMLSLLETDGELADEVLRFLMTEDDEGSDVRPTVIQPCVHSGSELMLWTLSVYGGPEAKANRVAKLWLDVESRAPCKSFRPSSTRLNLTVERDRARTG